jgi:hypothetical protein
LPSSASLSFRLYADVTSTGMVRLLTLSAWSKESRKKM